MPRAATAAIVIVVLVIVAAVVFFSLGGAKTRDITLYDTGAVSGDVDLNATGISTSPPPGSSVPPDASPAPSPGPGAQPIGTYAVGATVYYADGSSESLVGSSGLTVFRNGKAVGYFQYIGEFRAEVGVRIQQGTWSGTGSALRVSMVDKAGTVIATRDSGISNSNPIAPGGRATIISVPIFPDQLEPTGTPDGSYRIVFSMKLQPVYTSNGTAGPLFYVVFPDITVTVGTSESPPPPGGGGGGGGGGVGHYYLSLVDQRVFAAWRS